jgi:radical SAM protein with 4Fe4S-binding SPASM domain
MNSILNLKNRVGIFSYGNIHKYLYLVGAYLKFLISGRALDFPLMLQVQTQSFCNGQCSVCPYTVVSKKLPQGRMEWDLFSKIADECASEPMLALFACMLQNEPLLDSRVFDCVKHFKSISKGKKTWIVTNGELIDRYSIEEMVQSNLDSLVISLNTNSKDIYMSMNNGLDYDRVMKNISTVLSNETIRRKVMLSFLVTERNFQDVPQSLHYWHKKGVGTRVIGLSNRAGSLNEYEKLRLKTGYYGSNFPSKLKGRLMTRVMRVMGCHLPFYQMTVLFNGDVIICCHDWNRAIVVGNVKDSSLKEIWNSERMNDIRRAMLGKKYREIDSCKDCSITVG